jgi:uncharacterized protein (TIGR00369 family)
MITTHQDIDSELCGKPVDLKEGFAKVMLKTKDNMKVDETGLVHGGFIFGLADYAAMIAVNHPNVVLGAADVKFLKPVKAGETAFAEARVEPSEGKKSLVNVVVKVEDADVFKGVFTCFVLEEHVLK